MLRPRGYGPGSAGGPAKPTLSVSRTVVTPGARVGVARHGFPATAPVRLTIAGRRVERFARVAGEGSVCGSGFHEGLAAGRYTLAARARGLVVGRRLRVKVISQLSELAPLPEPAVPTPVPPAPDPPPPPPPDPITLVAAGDIACRPALVETATTCRHARTADLVQSLAPDAVAVLGDNQYEHGSWRTSCPSSTRRGAASLP